MTTQLLGTAFVWLCCGLYVGYKFHEYVWLMRARRMVKAILFKVQMTPQEESAEEVTPSATTTEQ